MSIHAYGHFDTTMASCDNFQCIPFSLWTMRQFLVRTFFPMNNEKIFSVCFPLWKMRQFPVRAFLLLDNERQGLGLGFSLSGTLSGFWRWQGPSTFLPWMINRDFECSILYLQWKTNGLDWWQSQGDIQVCHQTSIMLQRIKNLTYFGSKLFLGFFYCDAEMLKLKIMKAHLQGMWNPQISPNCEDLSSYGCGNWEQTEICQNEIIHEEKGHQNLSKWNHCLWREGSWKFVNNYEEKRHVHMDL